MRSGVGSLALLVASCASAPPSLLGQPIKKEVAVVFHVADGLPQTDDPSGTSALMLTVTEGLQKRGVDCELYTGSNDHPHAPLIEITVKQWDPGNYRERAGTTTVGAVAGVATLGVGAVVGEVAAVAQSGKYEVVAKVYRDGDVKPLCERTFTGFISGTNYLASANAGESVGDSIVSLALRDNAHCDFAQHSRFGSDPP